MSDGAASASRFVRSQRLVLPRLSATIIRFVSGNCFDVVCRVINGYCFLIALQPSHEALSRRLRVSLVGRRRHFCPIASQQRARCSIADVIPGGFYQVTHIERRLLLVVSFCHSSPDNTQLFGYDIATSRLTFRAVFFCVIVKVAIHVSAVKFWVSQRILLCAKRHLRLRCCCFSMSFSNII